MESTIEYHYIKTFSVDGVKSTVEMVQPSEEFALLNDFYLRDSDGFIFVIKERKSLERISEQVFKLKQVKYLVENDPIPPFVFMIDDANVNSVMKEDVDSHVSDIMFNYSVVRANSKTAKNLAKVYEELIRRYRLRNVTDVRPLTMFQVVKKMIQQDKKKCVIM